MTDNHTTFLSAFRFNRMELAGSLGDLGTLLPLAMGLIMVNGLDPVGLFVSVGLLYILGGLYYRVPIAVQPMKVISAYAIATAATPAQISASGWLLAGMLLFLGVSGLVDRVSRLIPVCVVRGVQLSTGVLLMSKGASFIAGTSAYQQAQGAPEPFLSVQFLGPVPVGALIGAVLGVAALLLLNSRRFPAGLVVVVAGFGCGLLLGGASGLGGVHAGFFLPEILPFGLPSGVDFTWALLALALPQIPMTLGNAVIANRDLSHEYFGGQSRRVTDRALCVSMGLANMLAALLGGMPLCHGAGGLAAHYRFGARTAGSNLLIGGGFLVLALGLGAGALLVLRLIPLAALGVLLVFAGVQLGLAIMDLRKRSDMFVTLAMCGIALGLNLAWAFGAGLGLALVLRKGTVRV
ncbi:putative sulfate/molybdate transporter [Pseudodesulfovibrio senegalensis]|uniref:Sulfate permease n=1 Tax=Pseudodesulfovibrio senegalensis TaxID=1721087 RepID=A0A6N6N5S8_9BACT|nr:putative sulfate/molybdate transporter [Pseudodesulfovibrio senegalensis]KAB1443098.1 sulfate permease [Pseudodesulfovibrio senegalensis]